MSLPLIVISAILTAICTAAVVAVARLTDNARYMFADGRFNEAAAKFQR